MKYYAVKEGRKPGIYLTWTECQEQTLGYSGAVFKLFTDREKAELFLESRKESEPINSSLPFAYIDGSFCKAAKVYSWGGFLCDAEGEAHIIQGRGNNPEYIQYWNATGEVRGALEVMRLALSLHIPELNLYYDHAGLEKWLNGEWECKNKLTQYYKDYYEAHRDKLKIHFIHVKGHTDITGNDLADLLAKDAAGQYIPSGKRKAALQALKSGEISPAYLRTLQ